jgi:hypothetical protein
VGGVRPAGPRMVGVVGGGSRVEFGRPDFELIKGSSSSSSSSFFLFFFSFFFSFFFLITDSAQYASE